MKKNNDLKEKQKMQRKRKDTYHLVYKLQMYKQTNISRNNSQKKGPEEDMLPG